MPSVGAFLYFVYFLIGRKHNIHHETKLPLDYLFMPHFIRISINFDGKIRMAKGKAHTAHNREKENERDTQKFELSVENEENNNNDSEQTSGTDTQIHISRGRKRKKNYIRSIVCGLLHHQVPQFSVCVCVMGFFLLAVVSVLLSRNIWIFAVKLLCKMLERK